MAKNSTKGIVDMLEELFAKAPSLPKNAKDVIVKITPFIAIIFGILGILGAIGGLGLFTFFSPLALLGGPSGIASYGTGFISALFWLAASVLLLAAYPGTKANKISGWSMLFWSEVVSLAGSVISMSLVGGIIGALIAFYLLYQIKPYYK